MSVLSLSGSPMVGTSWTRRLTSTWLLDDASVWRKEKKTYDRPYLCVCVCARARVCVCLSVCLSSCAYMHVNIL